MKRSACITLLLATLLISTIPYNRTFASHVIASDVSYVAIDSFKYDITFRFYRECANNPFDAPTRELFVRGEGDTNAIGINPKLISIRKLYNPCDNSGGCYPKNTSATGPGIEEFIYTQRIDLRQKPYSPLLKFCSIRFESRVCCRSTDVVNIATYDWVYAYAVLNRCLSPKHDSPSSKKPIQEFCINLPMYFTINALSDADSVSYAVEHAYTNYNYYIQYKSGFSMQSPMRIYDPTGRGIINENANPPIGFYFDSINGRIVCTPVRYGYYLVSTKIIEWMKDTSGAMTVSAVTYKPFVLIIRNCAGNRPPDIVGPRSFRICAESEFCQKFSSKDQPYIPPPPLPRPPPDSVKMSWISDIPNASFQVLSDTARLQEVRFCWKPDKKDIRSEPYTITLTATDNGCPYQFSTSHIYFIYVHEGISASFTTENLDCGSFELKSEVDSADKKNLQYRWDILDSLGGVIRPAHVPPVFASKKYPSDLSVDTARFREDGTYIVRLTITRPGACQIVLFDTLEVRSTVPLFVPADTILCCPNVQLNLRDLEHPTSAGNTWSCQSSPGIILGDTFFNPMPVCSKSERRFWLTYENSDSLTGCTVKDSFEVRLRPQVPSSLSDLNICIDSGEIDPMALGMTDSFDWSHYLYEWTCLDCSTSVWDRFYANNTKDPMFKVISEHQNSKVNASKSFHLTLQLIDSFGCVEEDTAYLRILGQPEIDKTLFANTSLAFLCSNDSGLLLQNHNYPSIWSLKSGRKVVNNLLRIDTMAIGMDTLALKSGINCNSDTLPFELFETREYDYLADDTNILSRKNHVEELHIQEGYTTGIRWFADTTARLEEEFGIINRIELPFIENSTWPEIIKIWVENTDAGRCTTRSDTTRFELRPTACYDIQWQKPNWDEYHFYSSATNWRFLYEWRLSDGYISFGRSWVYTTLTPEADFWISLKVTTNSRDTCTTYEYFEFGDVEDLSSSFSLYPNPVTSFLTISANDVEINGFQIVDQTGRVIQNGIVHDSVIDCRSLNRGIYVLVLKSAKGELRKLFHKL